KNHAGAVRSMTGYGRGLAERDGSRAEVEIRTVNHRFIDVKLRGAALDAQLEERVASRVRERVARGAVTVVVRLETAGGAWTVRVAREAARRVHAGLLRVAVALPLEPVVSLELVCGQPGVLVPIDGERAAASEAVSACAAEAVDRALEELCAMRDLE